VSGDHPAPRVVVVDDDLELLKLIAMLLRRIGAESQTFMDGREALSYLANEIPDLIILDMMLPDLDGLEVLRQIRAQAQLDRVPVLILSARADPSTIRKGLDGGADSYVTKPYIANSLIDRVRLLLSTGRHSRPRPESSQPPETNS